MPDVSMRASWFRSENAPAQLPCKDGMSWVAPEFPLGQGKKEWKKRKKIPSRYGSGCKSHRCDGSGRSNVVSDEALNQWPKYIERLIAGLLLLFGV
jgi:hypothetical protein